MYSHLRHASAAALLLLAFALTNSWPFLYVSAAFNPAAVGLGGGPNRLPQLSGAAAVEQLRQQGTYQALAEAVAVTRANREPNALIGQQTKLTANDGAAEDFFGNAVAVSGNTAVIGAPGDDVVAQVQGSAYVFVRSGGGWTQQARLNALDGAAFDNFGTAVAINGESVVIGAPSNNGNKGAVYVFVRNGAAWSQQAKLSAADGMALDYFGYTVAVSGETLAAGAYGDDANRGSAYVFVRNGVVWNQQAKLTVADGLAQDYFGISIALSGDTLAAGAFGDDIGASAERGSAYVFTRNGLTWSQQQKLTAGDGAAGDFFGNSVALSGDTLVAGAAQDDFNKGSAYVFTRSGAVWNQQAKLTANDGVAGDRFATAVAISGATVAVGASSTNIGGTQQQGAAYVFARNGAAWLQQAKLTAAEGVQQDQFGIAIAVDGDAVVAGTYGADVGVNLFQGAAYAFTVSGALAQQQIITAADGGALDYFGVAVAVSGNTAVIAAAYDDIAGNTDQGAIYVYVRSGATWNLQQKLSAGDGAANDAFGSAVAISGDTIAVGAYSDDIGTNQNQGSVYIFARNGAAWSQQAKLVNGFGAAEDFFGWSVAISGNTLVIGAYRAGAPTHPDQGVAFVFVRSGVTWASQALLTPTGAPDVARFGWSVAVSGNTTVIGATYGEGSNFGQGAAYVFARSGVTWSQQQKLTAADGALGDFFGHAVSLDGETLVVSASGDDVGANQDQGSAYVFVRNGAAWSQQQKLLAADGASTDLFGGAVALSGEGLVVGAYLDKIISVGEGSAYLFVRSGTTWEQRQKLKAPSGGGVEDHFGFAVAISGDTVVAGVPGAIVNVNQDQGKAYIFAGGACPAISINPASLANGTVSTSYNQTITAVGGTGPYDFTVSLGTLPPGLTLSASGLLSGTPVTAGTFNFTVTATAATLCPGSRTYTLIVNGPCPALVVNPASLSVGMLGQVYNQAFITSGGAPGYSFLVSAGTLPPNLVLSAAGVLSGTPTSAGNFHFTIQTTDNNGCQGTRLYTLTINLNPPPPAAPAVKGDFDGDGKTDLAAWTGASGNWAVINSGSNITTNTLWGAGYGPYHDVIVPGDYDGDGKADHAIWRGADSIWYIRKSSDGSFILDLWGANYAPYFDVPTPGDFDGDGKTDLAVWRPGNGTWYIKRSSNHSQLIEVWGQQGDTPVAADYDGDGKTDLAVWRPTEGNWLLKQSSGGTATILWGAGYAPYFDVPVPADYDGDGKADLAIWRGQDSLWYIRPSATPNTPLLQLWGANYAPYNDVPVPGDYDGDGQADIAVWRPTTGTWYVLKSANGTTLVQQHGQPGDVPVPKVQ